MITKPTHHVPIHVLGISQIIAYGLMFYVFATLKGPISERVAVDPSLFLYAVSGALVLQALLAPKIGAWVDYYGALKVMRVGLLLGALGMFIMAFAHSFWMVCAALLPLGLGYAMATYEVAFSAAVQMDEKKSRRNISLITFYGGVASSVTWLSVAPLVAFAGLTMACVAIGVILLLAGFVVGSRAPKDFGHAHQSNEEQEPFRWSKLLPGERRAMVALAASGTLEYLIFASTTLLWITYFTDLHQDAAVGVMLASIYGPFQVVGRVIEMVFGKHLDARLTALMAALMIPMALILVQFPSMELSILAMILFGMGHGVLTVSFGFVTNLYFRAEIYGRAKGVIGSPRAMGAAFGPSIGGLLYALGPDQFIYVMVATSLISSAVLAFLLLLAPTNEVHQKQSA